MFDGLSCSFISVMFDGLPCPYPFLLLAIHLLELMYKCNV